MRLGIYSDVVFRHDGEVFSNNQSFIRFVTSLPPRVDEVVLFGRVDPTPGQSLYVLPRSGVRVVALPYYRSAKVIWDVLRALPGSCTAFDAELAQLDAAWVFGPQPLSMLFALIAMMRRVPLVLGVRHNYPEYIRSRVRPGRAWAVHVARLMDGLFRLIARRAPTVAVGNEIARAYRGGAPVLATGFSLIPGAELRPLADALAAPWDRDRVVLSVGRLDLEKNPLLMLEVIDELRRRDPRWRLVIVGDGPLRGELQARVDAAGLADVVALRGEVRNGPDLWGLYRGSHVFLHVSRTEGLPQVLFEAQASGLPIVATAVGGVADALAQGRAGLLMRPDDAAAAVDNLERLAREPDLRARLITEGLKNAEHETLEAQLDRVGTFLRAAAATEDLGNGRSGRMGANWRSRARRRDSLDGSS